MSKNLSKKNTLKFDDNNTLQIMCGVYHSNLDVIEKKLNVTLSSENADVSPVIDMGRSSFLATTNRLNSIDSITDIYPQALFVS